ncbi:hypothetical protein JCM33374_g3982 [Metschnikowia sp. JCM 33374]|nr:hypothetical protein JCM33374_g3982 [Metschnikowia sp. JCM 33374]
MDVFSSALKNPLPPARKKNDQQVNDPKSVNPDSNMLPKSEPSGKVAPANTPSFTEAPPTQAQLSGQNQDHDNKKKNSRRRHRNSHLGCGICKKRRIKCDEHLPQCFNCIKGRLHCAYLNLDAPARNALRLAQYNQNLRDDRSGDSSPKSAEKTAQYGDESSNNTPSRPPSYPSVMNSTSEPPPVYASNHVSSGSNSHNMPRSRKSSIANGTIQQGPINPPISGPPSSMPSMYVPMIQLQPINSGIPYPQIPMQMITGQQPHPMMYQSDQIPMQIPSQHLPAASNQTMNPQPIMCYPAQPPGLSTPYDNRVPGSFIVPMQRQYGSPASMPNNSPFYPPGLQPPDAMRPPPKVLGSPPIPQPPVVPHPTPSSSTSPMVFAKSALTPTVTSLIHPETKSAGTTASKEMDLPSINSLSKPASNVTSPLSCATGATSADIKSVINNEDLSVKLAPIQIKAEEKQQVSGEPDHSHNDTEKISSIKMLLS